MPPIKMQANTRGIESDGDVSGGESDRSNTSRENEGGRDSSDGDEEADSDDSSEMDEGECENRRNECIDNLSDLERQFGTLREQLYRERIAQVEQQLTDVKGGKSAEYLVPLSQLQENMKIRTEVAGIMHRLRLENIKNKFDAEEQAARQNFESEKSLAYDFFYEEIIDKMRKLEEDRHNVDISWGEGSEWFSRSRSKSRRKAVTVSGPYIVYMLKPQDIHEDWTVIRKALKRAV